MYNGCVEIPNLALLRSSSAVYGCCTRAVTHYLLRDLGSCTLYSVLHPSLHLLHVSLHPSLHLLHVSLHPSLHLLHVSLYPSLTLLYASLHPLPAFSPYPSCTSSKRFLVDNNEIRTMGELQSVEASTGRGPDKGAFSQYRGPSPGGSQFNRFALSPSLPFLFCYIV
jgi:hypothetical protein